MLGRFIGFFCCLLCALPFFYLSWEGKQKDAAPLAFWSGDDTLKDKVKDIPAYNAEMSRLFLCTACLFSAAAAFWLLHPLTGITALIVVLVFCTFVLHKAYILLLKKYS